jgi:predicted RNA-binding protein YlqC (UPF0109 family)
MLNHSPSGTYPITEFLSQEVRELTIEQVIALLVYNICSLSDDVDVTIVDSPRIKVIEFDTNPTDRKFVLGRHGYIIDAIRTIAKAILGPRVKDFRYDVDLTPNSVSRKSNATE